MTLSEELKWRGFINQTTFKDLTELDKKTWTFYHGFDASADSQTVGNLAAMMFDRTFIRHGHKAILLAGGATSLIGDPGGKDNERPLQDVATVMHNTACAAAEIKRLFEGYNYKLVNNLDWTKNLSVIDFLRDVGKHFSMTPLVQRDYIARRIGKSGEGISYAEFSYTVLQGMDYLHLYDDFGVTLQLGGSDQWGNCLSGVELIRRARGQTVHVITLPLITNKVTGKKFGKSEGGAVWLSPAKTTPQQFYQFWINADDDSVEDYLKIYTELDKPTIDMVMKEFHKDHSTRTAQKRLAQEVTRLVHGDKALKVAEDAASFLTQPADSKTETISVKEDASIVETLVSTGLASSKTEARRLLESGGIYVNDLPTHSHNFEASDFNSQKLVKLRRGKTLNNTIILRKK